MSYPKKHPAMTQLIEKDARNQQRKEQMKGLLITKFRGKYSVNISQAEQEKIDRVIRSEVDRFLDAEQLTEQNLVKLDKRLLEVLGAPVAQDSQQSHHRKKNSLTGPLKGAPNQIQTGDGNGNWQDYLSQSSAVSSKHSIKRSDMSRSSVGGASQRSRSGAIKDAGNMIIGGHEQPAAGQNEDYWNKIIMHNVDQFNKEKEEAKQRSRDNQARIKEELEKQMFAQKKAKEEEKRKEMEYVDKIRIQTEEGQRIEKSKHDDMKRKLHQEKNVRDIQLKESSTKKTEEQRLEKMVDDERRKKIDREASDQASRDKLKIDNYRRQCQQQYQENIVMKEHSKKGQEDSKDPTFAENNMLGSLFAEKRNIAQEKRIINDRKVELIKDKIVGDQSRKDMQIAQSIDQVQKQRLISDQLADDRKKKDLKAKEIATKQFLDLQIQEKQQRQILSKVTEQQEAKIIHLDVETFHGIEKQKKEVKDTTMKAHKESLEKQMLTTKKKDTGMALHEYQLNKKILEGIEQQSPSTYGSIKRGGL